MDTISSNMDGNPYFPEQKSLVDKLIAERLVYGDLVQAAAKGSTQAIIERDEKREAIVTLLRNLSNQVTAVCQGNIAMRSRQVLSTKAISNPAHQWVTPPPPKVSLGTGEGQLLCKAQKQGTWSTTLFVKTKKVQHGKVTHPLKALICSPNFNQVKTT